MIDVILASGSSGRKELMRWLGVPFTSFVTNFPEEDFRWDEFDDAHEFVRSIAYGKMMYAKAEYPENIIITADSSVFLGDRNFGKPVDIDEAREFLHAFSGKDVSIVTAVCFWHPDYEQIRVESEESIIRFMQFSPEAIDKLVTKEHVTKYAGGFDVVGAIRPYIRELSGSPSSAIGLPLQHVKNLLEEVGVRVPVDVSASVFEKTGFVEPRIDLV